MKAIGVFDIGCDAVTLFADPVLSGGSFDLRAKRITVGTGGEWWETLCTLLHEAMEYAAAQLGVRYLPSVGVSPGHDDYLFVMTHPQFSEVVARAARFAAAADPLLQAERAAIAKKPKKAKGK